MKFKAERYYTKRTVNGLDIYGIRMGYYDRAYKWVVVNKSGEQVSEFWKQKEAADFAKLQNND
jgi:hypothetical protein